MTIVDKRSVLPKPVGYPLTHFSSGTIVRPIDGGLDLNRTYLVMSDESMSITQVFCLGIKKSFHVARFNGFLFEAVKAALTLNE